MVDPSAVELNLDANRLRRTGTRRSAGLVDEEFTKLPDGLDNVVRELAVEVTDKSASRFEKAVALQNWFRRGGGFTYDDSRADSGSNGADALADFLREGPGGRTGYCEQFAASMAVMARILGIPSRVAVGFLNPDQVDDDTYVYSAHDLHAWPELYIAGAGWVRFEPTPGGRAESVPGYTTQAVVDTPDPTTNPTDEAINQPPVRDSASPSAAPQDDAANGAGGASIPWLPILLVLVGVALVVLLLMTPRALRRRRRLARWEGGPEDAWIELRDTESATSGCLWPRARSPRQTADALVPLVRCATRRVHPRAATPGPRDQPGGRRRARPDRPGPRAVPLRRARPGPCRVLGRRRGAVRAGTRRRLHRAGPAPCRVVATVAVHAGAGRRATDDGRRVRPAGVRRRCRPRGVMVVRSQRTPRWFRARPVLTSQARSDGLLNLLRVY